jgi:hypothetical protein
VRIEVDDDDGRVVSLEPFGSWHERDWESVA